MFELAGGRIPIKCWADYVEPGAETQARNLANHPKTLHHIVLCPDVHEGYGSPIGAVSVMSAICPSMCGVDIGCGLMAANTGFTKGDFGIWWENPDDCDLRNLRELMTDIREAIPVGFKHHDKSHSDWMPKGDIDSLPVVRKEYGSATEQIGTLGGGK